MQSYGLHFQNFKVPSGDEPLTTCDYPMECQNPKEAMQTAGNFGKILSVKQNDPSKLTLSFGNIWNSAAGISAPRPRRLSKISSAYSVSLQVKLRTVN